jgi:hypothetical protein
MFKCGGRVFIIHSCQPVTKENLIFLQKTINLIIINNKYSVLSLIENKAIGKL